MKELLGTWEVVSGDLKFYKYRLERGDALEFDDYLSFSNDWGWGRSEWKIGAIIKGRNSSSDDFYVTSDDQLIRRDLITKNKAGDLLSYPKTVEEKFGIQFKDEMLEISSNGSKILLKRIKRSD